MANGDSGQGFGVAHLGSMPITLSFGIVLLAVLVILVLLRYFFADITVRGGVK